MNKKYCQLSAEPFCLTPDPGFVYAHEGYLRALANMRHTLEQGDGFLVITGRSGIGKTTLVDGFLAGLKPDDALTVTLDSTNLVGNGLLRSVAHAFGIDLKGVDKAALLHNLEELLIDQTRALLIIDEAHTLSEADLKELRILTYMRTNSRPLMQIFLFGQEQLHERLQTSGIAQPQQIFMSAYNLEPLSLQETRDSAMSRLGCAGWRGKTAIAREAFALIHRFSQGLPLYISKLCARLFVHGAGEQRKRLSTRDIETAIRVIQDGKLPPLPLIQAGVSSPQVREPVQAKALPATEEGSLTAQKQELINSNAKETRASSTSATYSPLHASVAEAANDSTPAEPVAINQLMARTKAPAVQIGGVYPRSGWLRRFYRRVGKRRFLSYSVAALVVLVSTYLLGVHNAGQRQEPVRSGAFTTWLEPEFPYMVELKVKTPTRVAVLPNTEPQRLAAEKPRPATEFESGSSQEVEQEVDDVLETVTVDSLDSTIELHAATADSPVVLADAVKQETRDEKIDKLLLLGAAAIARDRLRTPKNQSAWLYYRQVLELDPGNQVAEHGLERIVARYGELTTVVMKKRQYDKAQVFINRGLGLVSGDSTLLALQGEVDAGREREKLLAFQASEANKKEPEQKPEPRGIFSTLKRFFTGQPKTE